MGIGNLRHAAVVALRNFGVWLGSTHVVLAVSFAKSVEAAAVAAAISGAIDLIAHTPPA